MKDKYTYEVGDPILLIEAEEAVCGDIYGEIIFVDPTYAIARLTCETKFESQFALKLYGRQGGYNEIIEKDDVLSILGKGHECGEYDLFFDMYTKYKWGYKTQQYFPIQIMDKNGEEIPYFDVKEPDWISYCGLQVVDQIRFFKLFGEPAPDYNLIPLSDNELKALDLSPEGNYYKGVVCYLKELIQGEWAELELNGVYCCGDIVYSHGNRAVIQLCPAENESFECLERISFNDLKLWPGTADLPLYDNSPNHEYIVFDQITGETDEQFKSMDVIADDGTELTGEICGYRYVGRKIVGRYLRFVGEQESALANRLFADRANDNMFMCQKIDADTTYYYFGLKENETVNILH